MSETNDSIISEMDKIIGRRIRLCRQSHKMSQTKLAKQVGIAWQQIQKYEGGKNRVSASMLWRIAEVFDLPVSYFFEHISEDIDEAEDLDVDLSKWRAAKIVEMYSGLGDAEQDALFSFLKSLSLPERAREVAE